MSIEQLVMRMYRGLARAFPEEFRQACGTSLVETAEDTVRDAVRHGGVTAQLWLLPRLLLDLTFRVIAEHCHDVVRDVRHAARMLVQAKGFTLAAAACLAMGIGTTTTIFSEIRWTALRELPGIRDPAGLLRFQRPVSYPYYREILADRPSIGQPTRLAAPAHAAASEIRDNGHAFDEVAAYMAQVPIVISVDGARPQRVWAHLTTPNYFDVLGMHAATGRLFGPEERTPGAAQTIVISDRLWKTKFGGDSALIGRTLRIDGRPLAVIGVAPPGYLGATPSAAVADLWIPTTVASDVLPELAHLEDSRAASFDLVGRLRPGLTNQQAENALDALIRRVEVLYNDPNRDSREPRVRLLPGGRMFPMRDEDLPQAIGFPLVLVSLVLVMASGNVANMLIARNAARRREFAVRLSLGASRSRIVRQLLTESFLLASLGVIGGVAMTFWLLRFVESLQALMPEYTSLELHLDWQALVFAMLLAAGSAVLFGLAPALRASREDIYAGLKPQVSSLARRGRWLSLRNLLVFQQVMLSIVLLLLTGFVVVGWNRIASVNVGFEVPHLYRLGLDPVRDGYTAERARRFFDDLPERLHRVPGVTAVSLAQTLPLAMASSEALLADKIDIANGPTAIGATRADRVGTGFFETAGIPLRRGRTFDDRDQRDDARVLIVNDTMVSRVWPGEDPVGRTVKLDDDTWQVIGVVGDIRPAFPLAPTRPAVYRPNTPSGFASPSTRGVTVMIRSAPGVDLPTRIRQEIESIDPNLTVFQLTRMDDDVQQTVYIAQVATYSYGVMGVFGLILASVGLAGVTSYAVARRTHEIGVRMALGARRADVLWLVLRESSVIVAAGTLVGLAAALALTRVLGASLDTMAETTRTSVSDPLLLIGGPALLAALAMIACYLPARRSTRINPVTALRAE